MDYLLIWLGGACVGVMSASSRIPRIRWLSVLSSTVLGFGVAWAVLATTDTGLAGALSLVAASILGSALYAGACWKRARPSSGLSYWSLVAYDVAHPRSLRQLLADDRTPPAETGDQDSATLLNGR